MDSLVPFLIVTLLLLLNALFVAAEFAIVSAPRTAIERRASSGDRLARTVHADLDVFAAAGSVHRDGAARYHARQPRAGHVWRARARRMADRMSFEAVGWGAWAAAHTIASVISIAILTYFHIVVGEMIPKSLALQSAERTALWITPVMLTVRAPLFPFVIILNAVGNGLLRLVGIDRRDGAVRAAVHARGARAHRRGKRGGRAAAR